MTGGKGASSLGPITELVLRAKKEDWERRENERVSGLGGLLGEVVRGLERSRDAELGAVEGEGEERETRVKEISDVWHKKIEDVKKVFESAEGSAGVKDESRRRKVPDWCVDDITFSVMLDPVVVCFSLFPYTLSTFFSFVSRNKMLTPRRPKQANPTTAPQ